MRITYDPVNGKEIWKSIPRKQLLHLDDLKILRQYNAEIRGLHNYCKIANNATVRDSFGYMIKYSMYKTSPQNTTQKSKKSGRNIVLARTLESAMRRNPE